MKHIMELVWNRCTDCLPKEDLNTDLWVTDGKYVWEAIWERTERGPRFSTWHFEIIPGDHSDGFWWTDPQQAVRDFAPFHQN